MYVSSNAVNGAYLYAVDAETGVILTYRFYEDFYDSDSWSYGYYSYGWVESRNYRFFDLTARGNNPYLICYAWGYDWHWRYPDPHGYYSWGDEWNDYRLARIYDSGEISDPRYETEAATIDALGYFDGYLWFEENGNLYRVRTSGASLELVAESSHFEFFELNGNE